MRLLLSTLRQNLHSNKLPNLNVIKSFMSTQEPSIRASIIFRQLFDKDTCTYTYLLADAKTRDAILIDPVIEYVDRDLKLVHELALNLKYALNTHVHADHITGTGRIKKQVPLVKSVIASCSKARADIQLNDGDRIHFGDVHLLALSTPGHTDGCMSYVCHAARCVFTGDALLIRGCGRTDFQQGNAETLYNSVHQKLYALPDDYFVYPGHDYRGQMCSSIKEEKLHNPRLTKTKTEFVQIMKSLNLDYPKRIKESVPANMVCGLQENCE